MGPFNVASVREYGAGQNEPRHCTSRLGTVAARRGGSQIRVNEFGFSDPYDHVLNNALQSEL